MHQYAVEHIVILDIKDYKTHRGFFLFSDNQSLTLVATVEDWSKVAAHVHCDTIVVAVRPAFTFPPALNAKSREF